MTSISALIWCHHSVLMNDRSLSAESSMKEKKMLNDDVLQDVSGGLLKDDWKETLSEIAQSYRDENKSYNLFQLRVRNGYFNDMIKDSQWLSKEDSLAINNFLDEIKWE